MPAILNEKRFSYAYDYVGNVKTITETGTTTSFTYDHLDRLTGSSGGVRHGYPFDAAFSQWYNSA